ncbi:GTP cyclohydrolase 1 type 2-like protein [Colletotrichum siamense]|nr:GTP cyclohydrolase 1 type 2-like protein [Colletotrichum siamense]KAF4864269.1 GTP cyclohydrolase 1 type 2-like protein [Colletotrichum siamense]KAF5516763.1 GTP cyclohydrolase 1 type 2-like protein [Colletotrichum siamense]
MTMTERYKLHWTVPASHLVATKDAVFKSGAGVYDEGKYIQVAFQITGQGQFMPVAAAGAVPHTGAVDQLEQLLEYKVEVMCAGRDVAKAAVAALKSAHPFEVPAYEVYKLEDI